MKKIKIKIILYSQYALLDHGIPEIQILILSIKLVIRNLCQLLIDLPSKGIPIFLNLSSSYILPERIL